jgi:type II secretory pathway pseudopilin PulG
MPEENAPEAQPATEPKKRGRWVLAIVILLVAAYLAGFIPWWQKTRAANAQLQKTEHALTAMRMTKDLGSAAIDARRGAYEPARQEASTFFTAANFEISQGDGSSLSAAQRQDLGPLLSNRDEIITLLARSDPASADRLSDLYVKVRKALGV